MASGGGYGSRVWEAHTAGDLHVHGLGGAGGYWASWNSPDLSRDVGDFISRASREWNGFQRIAGFEQLLSVEAHPLKRLIDVDAELLLGFNGDNLGGTTLDDAFSYLMSSKTCKIVPVIRINDDFDWESNGNAPFFGAVNSLCSPIFVKTGDKGGPWTSMDTTGVLAMVSLNLPRAAYEAKEEGRFFDRVGELTELAVEGLEARRVELGKKLADGGMPATSSMVKSFDGFFCAVGVVGVNEALQNLVDRGIGSMQGKAIAYKTMELIGEILEEKGGGLCLSAEPSDGARYRLARLDREKYPDIKTRGINTPFYTGSTCLPVDYTDDLWDALEHQKKLQTLYGGGSIFNIALGREIRDTSGCKLLTRRIIEKTSIPCFTFSPSVSVEGVGKFERSGYWYGPVSEMSAAEKEEVGLRKPFAVASGW